MTPKVELELQVAIKNKPELYIPGEKLLIDWITMALLKANYKKPAAIISLRIVDEDEITELNKNYRQIDKPTNVLSFPYDALPGVDINLLGDVAVCASVVKSEATQQSKTLEQHWAHIIIHGVLHLLGYDHIEDKQAEEMEALEISILKGMGFANPYEEEIQKQ